MPPLPMMLALASVSLLSGPPKASGQASPTAAKVVLENPVGALESMPLDEFDLGELGQRDVVFLRFEGLESEASGSLEERERATLVLESGDRVLGAVHGGSGDRLELMLTGNALLGLEVDSLRSIVFEARADEETRAGFVPPESGDLLFWLRPGDTIDRVPGTLLEFTPEGPRLEGAFGERVFAWEEVAALFIEPLGGGGSDQAGELEPGLRPGARVIVDLVDGGRLRGRLTRLAPAGCLLELGAGGEVLLPLASVDELMADDGRFRYLSELAPSAVEEGSPFGDDLGLVWNHRVDASVTGSDLRAGGRRWRRGLGVHAPSRLTFTLDGSWQGLRGACALDDQVLLLSTRGSVVFRIHVDGEERWASGVVRAGDAPLEFPKISLEGARELVLEADMATEFHVGDRADWLRLLLVRGS